MRSDRGGCRASAAVSALRAWDVAVQFRAAGATGGTNANKPTSPNSAICYRLSETEDVVEPRARRVCRGDGGYDGEVSTAKRVNREAVVVLGWGRAILMQLAHPLVAAGVGAHSDFDAGALAYVKRMRGTISAMLSLTFGTEAEIRRSADRINAIHRRVHGELPQPVGPYEAGARYDATDPALLAWVHATLVDSQLRTYALFVGPLRAGRGGPLLRRGGRGRPAPGRSSGPAAGHEGRASTSTCVRCSRRTGSRSAPRPVAWPTALLALPGGPWSAPARWLGQLVTVGLLPPDLRKAYGFTWLERDHRRLRQAAAALRAARRIAPRMLREWPAARRAPASRPAGARLMR